ncbi:MAG TPA: methyltransferase domain-containing protein [Amaricoccus sp.]|nr:methyltransferase domain-containing protein [Amaricoccus sp.]
MTEPNSEQAEYWNTGPGQNWARHQAELDQNHAEITERLVAACAVRPGERVLDVGCGAGGSTFRLAAAAGEGGHVEGLDISEPLLAYAERRRAELGLTNVSFAVGDAQTAPLVPGRHDLVTSRFGMMFFADPAAAFANLARSLRPGGRMVFVAWAGPEENPWFAVPQRAAVARLGQAARVAPDAPGPTAFRDAPRVLRLLAGAGLRDAAVETADLHIVNPGGIDAVVALCGEIGPVSRMLREKGGTAEDKAAILAAIREAFAPYAGPDGARIPARVHLFSARA